MRIRFVLITTLLLALVSGPAALAQDDELGRELLRRIGPAVAAVLVRDAAGNFREVGSGVFVRGDGLLLTPYNLVQGAREIQVRMADGETYDRVEVAATDERRNVAVLRVRATSTPYVAIGATNEASVGVEVRAMYNAGGSVTSESCGVLSAITLAEEIPGAGAGFRVLKFTEALGPESSGGILLDNYGQVIGLVAPLAKAGTRSYAVPLYNVVGLVRSVSVTQSAAAAAPTVYGPRNLSPAIPIYQSSTTPIAPMPQADVPQRPTTALAPAGPGSLVISETNPARLLAASKTLYVTSRSNIFKSVQLVNELRKRHELTDWNLSLVDESEVADLILEIEHVPLTWEFNFSVRHQRTGVIVTAGKVYAWGGGDGAPLMASRVVERLTKLRASVPPQNKTENAAPKK
ncbi:MAG TPA: serine protease [Pyrinomonadaceae bacterium]|nr:serine protease [Pyrinomonadaceae bacterium]